MIKIFYAIAVSAIAAACFVAFPSLSQQVHATPPAQAVTVDHTAIRTASVSCGQNAWPYIDAACLRNASGSTLQTHEVRLVSADRFESATGR
jgi:hypothetical protein